MPAERLPVSDCRTRDASRPSDPSLTGQEGTINDISEETIRFKTADFDKEVTYAAFFFDAFMGSRKREQTGV